MTVVDDELRSLAPQVLGTLIRRYGQFDACEDAVQEALLAAALQWPVEGVPANPRGWLITVAVRRLTDQWRSDDARRRREQAIASMAPTEEEVPDRDDTLTLLFLCCHPAGARRGDRADHADAAEGAAWSVPTPSGDRGRPR